jgi:oxaloacetate decarboxylase gamma subunit
MTDLLETGVVLMATGMGTVFALLALLVLVIHGVSKTSLWLAPAGPPSSAPHAPPTGKPAADIELVTVIGAAVAAYRRDHNPGK